MSKVAVIGAGLMGSGIAQVSATAGYDVVLRDVGAEQLAQARAGIEASLAKFAAKGKLDSADADAALARVSTTTDLDAAADASIVVEAVFEEVDVKREVFTALDGLCRDDAVLATNTSAIPITQIAGATQRPESVVGTHFFSPVPLMTLCELVRGRKTGDETLTAAKDYVERIGKTAIVVNRDVGGFVTTRLICALAMEAIRLYESGVASAEDIDLACKLGFGHAMGPLATTDLTGIDVLRHATLNIWQETADGQFHPPELLTRMVEAGELGRKSGQGFYDYG